MSAPNIIDAVLFLLGLTTLDEPDPGDDPGRGQKPIGG